ncbi:hypothetical protein [Streptomyces sp. NPDC058674]|uniref:hypothetical protein n=1 Tax=Streptomyces sp. NPDC058674 TaxID=3346592 RepID=UPI0036653926
MARREAAEGLVRLEGYLWSERARAEGAEAGRAFAGRLTWLGPDEQAEVARHFAQVHVQLRRHMLGEAVVRARELRGEYGRRYARLRLRLAALSLSAVVGAVSGGWYLCMR